MKFIHILIACYEHGKPKHVSYCRSFVYRFKDPLSQLGFHYLRTFPHIFPLSGTARRKPDTASYKGNYNYCLEVLNNKESITEIAYDTNCNILSA